MFARTMLGAARWRVQRPQSFTRFFQSLTPALATVTPRLRAQHGVTSMAIAGALWRATRAKYGGRYSAQRIQEACRLYKKHGVAIVRAARTRPQQPPRRQGRRLRHRGRKAAGQRRAATRVMATTTSHKRDTATAMTVATRPVTFAAFAAAAAPPSVTAKIVGQRELLRVLFHGTAAEPRLSHRVATARRVLRCVALQRARTQRAAAAATAAATARARVTPQKPQKPQTHARDFRLFARAVRTQVGVRDTTARQTAYLRRMWHLLSRKHAMTQAERVRVAARLLSRLRDADRAAAARRVRGVRVTRARGAVTPAAAAAHTTAPSSTRRRPLTQPAQRKRSLFLRFYRAMVLTGDIPNYPHGARSRTIKLLWKRVHHRKSLQSRIRLARRLLANAAAAAARATSTATTAPAAATAAAKPRSVALTARARARSRVKRAAAATTVARAVARRPLAPRRQGKAHTPRPSTPVVRFTVPANYRASPFAATYAVLNRYLTNQSPDARMRAIARAWSKTEAHGHDTRDPHARIQAVVDALQRK